MRKITVDCTLGGLLHDIGKIVFRAGEDRGRHSESGDRWLRERLEGQAFGAVLECVRWHHAEALRQSHIDRDSPAYIVYMADNIAAGAGRIAAEEGGEKGAALFKKDMPLSSVFNIMNVKDRNIGSGCCEPVDITEQTPYPSEDITSVAAAQYREKLLVLAEEIPKTLASPGGACINSLLALLEERLSFVPSSTRIGELCDISFYDHCKITAAAATAIAEYLAVGGVTDLRAALFDNEKSFMDEKAFLLFSCDFSGIQKFIYMVGPEGALRSLRSRSFVLEMFMEHIIDELLDGCGLSRANLIYSGGGHAYLLLPNTGEVKDFLKCAEKNVNRWLSDNFGAALFLAFAWQECSPHDLQNVPEERDPYPQIFRELSAKLSSRKDARWNADELRKLNSASSGGRECRICGSLSDVGADGRCKWCRDFADISSLLQRVEYISVTRETKAGCKYIPLPDVCGREALYACFTDFDGAKTLTSGGGCVRTYRKNRAHAGPDRSTNIYMGDYNENPEMNEAAKEAQGIKRIAVCRADVDNLGAAFIDGFKRGAEGADGRFRYQTLSRTAAFSRQMSMFFKYYINTLLSCGDSCIKPFCFPGQTVVRRNVNIVYSGGDDIFIVGGWDDVIGAICDIREAFKRYTEDKLTLSAGVGIFRSKYPIYRAASVTEELVDTSKENPGKNSITLFEDRGHTYKWSDFREGVLPKAEQLASWFQIEEPGEEGRGTAFLYNLLKLAREAEEQNRINIARAAYLLTRLEPKDADRREEYGYLSRRLLSWLIDPDERGKLITAIYLYVYLTRQRSG